MRLLGTRQDGSGGGGTVLVPRRATTPGLPPETLIDLLEAERDRWVLWLPVCLGLGIGLYFALPVEPPLVICIAPVPAALALWLVLRRGTVWPAVLAALLAVTIGLALAKLRADAVAAPLLAERFDGGRTWASVAGWLEEREARVNGGERLTVRVAWIDGMLAEETPYRVRVTVRKPMPHLVLGDGVTFRAQLKPPPDAALPGGYNFARLAYFQRVGAIGFTAGDVRREPRVGPIPADLAVPLVVARWRATVGDRIRAALPGPNGAFAAALVTGERGDLTPATLDALRDSGLSHILAISGFNMAVMAGALFFAVRALLALSPTLALTLPLKQIAAFAGLAGAFVCLLLAGAGSATTRAFVMIALMLLAVLLGRGAVSMRNLAWAALLLLGLAPETLLDVSFQMSFAAVVALMAVYDRVPLEQAGALPQDRPPHPRTLPFVIGHIYRGIRDVAASTTLATLAVAPFATFHFHKIAVFGVIANILAVPLFAFVMMPLIVVILIAMLFGLEYWPVQGLGAGVGLLLAIADTVAQWPGASIRVPAMPLVALLLAMLGGLWLCLWRQRWRWLGLVPAAGALLLAGTGSRPDLLVARAGAPIAVRLPDGRLSALPGPDQAFTLSVWLEADGDGRDAAEIAVGEGFFCDDQGCVVRIGPALIAIPTDASALADDCRRAEVVIMRFERVRPCPAPRLVIDRTELTQRGSHALTLTRSGWTVATVTGPDGCGNRPWCPVSPPDRRATLPANARPMPDESKQ